MKRYLNGDLIDLTPEEESAHRAGLALDAAQALNRARQGMSLPRAQFAIAAMQAGLITETEAEEWAVGAALPAIVTAEIAKLAAGAQTAARIEAKAAATVRRLHPLVVALGASLGLTAAQVDALFTP